MKHLLMAAVGLLLVLPAWTQKTVNVKNDADEEVLLWNNRTAPHSNGETLDETLSERNYFIHTSEARLYLYKADPSRATGQAILLCPGGGYSKVCIPSEGFRLAKFLQGIGVTVAVLKYRLPNDGHWQATLEDAQEGLRYLRRHAAQLRIDPAKVGMAGSSAGGHLTAYTCNFTPQEERPAFAILFYPPVFTGVWRPAYTRLWGEGLTDSERDHYSLDKRVTEKTPPTLILLSDDDPTVPTIHSTRYYDALKEHKVKAAMHIYPSGGHGWAGTPNFKYDKEYKQAIADWLSLMNQPPKP